MNTIPKAKDINQVVRTHRIISTISIIGLVITLITVFIVYTMNIKEINKRAYFVFPNQVYEGEAQSTGLINYYMAKDHVRKFIGLMFSHDQKTFKSRVESAMNLIDKEEGKLLYYQFKTGRVYENYVEKNIRTRVDIDSITLNMRVVPIEGVAYFKQATILQDNEEFLIPIAFKFTLQNTSFQNEINSAGLIIKGFQMISYKLQTDEYENLMKKKEPETAPEEVAP